MISRSESLADVIRTAPSADEAKRLGNSFQVREYIREDWCDAVKLQNMEEIFRAKLAQHEYVQKQLLASHDRIIVEDSSRDAFWGRGPDWRGQNNAGKLWMKIRDEP